MSERDTRPTKVLFREWQNGDGKAGQAMAQRFADWYYAIATSRLGESGGAEICRTASQAFGQGVHEITEARALVPWAHDIINKELEGTGGRIDDANEPNLYTGGQPPKTLLANARSALPKEFALLEAVYGGKDPSEYEPLAKELGGNPLGILKARYALKRWLRDHANVPFEVAPAEPNLDRAPLPLYESNRMATVQEETTFEQWMISDLDLCQDIAEFAHFALALRGGVPASAPASRPAAASKAAAASASTGNEIEPVKEKKGFFAWLLGLFGLGGK